MRIIHEDAHHLTSASASASTNRPLEIALIGSGITSNCIAVGLQNCPNVSITIYEAKDRFMDYEGQNFGLTAPTLQALRLIHPSLRGALTAAGATPSTGQKRQISMGPDAGSYFVNVPFPDGLFTIVRRGYLVKEARELLENQDMTKLGKRLVRIKETMGINGPRYKLTFADGSDAYADGVIGGDGVNSFTRSYVLGPTDPNVHAKRTNTVWFPKLIPRARAIEIFGEEFCSFGGQRSYTGNGGLIDLNWSDHYSVLEVDIDFLRAGWPYPDNVMYHPWDKEEFKRDVEKYGWIGTKMVQVFLEGEDKDKELVAGTRKVHEAARTWVNGGVCIAGDAAGAFQPHAGNGANQSIQDALALVTVLKTIRKAEDIHAAFQVYEFWRKELRDQVGVESEEEAMRLSGLSPAGLDVHRLKKFYDAHMPV